MFDARLRPLIDPPLDALGRLLARAGVGANAVTLAGLLPAVGAGLAIAHHHYVLALALVLLNRLIDGLDGAVARIRGPSDWGGYLDMVADYVFYLAVPLGFGFASAANTPAAMVLVASFTLTAVSFLVFAALAAKHGRMASEHGTKSFFYSTGLAEGAETIAVFVAMCLWPAMFVPLAYGFAALCLLTVVQRTALARRTFRK
ncbi:CDP-alcohol phosphatidyltransferase family protein [Altererythrobacter sp. KTW20L]|uniref:CDP-alcohol phosphatidyltransferase family protein n=1 Tax=Altererythrobacter sp. KTW20L TaxID=2942210 RepID=UPI0020BDD3AD|nr:CDP-alcohol phosphatidyltransferase family protein [Altererythrobacter sp. KTW20L]MCL6250776.1 CDP-alcohol phosphatidyltransferase family protein [Altererythrobacter sp. KTW20L]